VRDDGLASRMADAATDMGEQASVRATLDSICAQAVEGLRADGCGIFLVRKRKVQMVALSGPQVAEAERIQLETDEGPCLETVRTSRTILVSDLRADTPWPRWAGRMIELGWLSALSVHLTEDRKTVGSLNMFCALPDAFTSEDVDLAELFARHASLALASSRAEMNLASAVDARHRVGVAQGLLMAHYGITLQASFDALRRHSQHKNVKLHEVASYVIEHQRLPPVETEPTSAS
jgi:GAF domain-containing protein